MPTSLARRRVVTKLQSVKNTVSAEHNEAEQKHSKRRYACSCLWPPGLLPSGSSRRCLLTPDLERLLLSTGIRNPITEKV